MMMFGGKIDKFELLWIIDYVFGWEVNFIDIVDVYVGNESEWIVGDVFFMDGKC